MRNLLAATLLAIAVSTIAADKPPETLEQMKAQAAAAEKSKQVDLYIELARRQLEVANNLYNSSADQARDMFLQSAESAEHAGQSALDSNHHLKQTEIKLREISHRMSDIRRTWAFEDRAPLDPAIQRVEAARNKLLDRMFKK
jgi:DNA-binding transcriptional regulator YbjK